MNCLPSWSYSLTSTNGHLSIMTTSLQQALAWQAFPCGFGTKNEEREPKTAWKIARVKEKGRGWGRMEGNACSLASFPSPSPLFHFLVLVSFLARPKPKIPFLCLSLLWNQTETFATQASGQSIHCTLTLVWTLYSGHIFITSTFFCTQCRYWGEVQLY